MYGLEDQLRKAVQTSTEDAIAALRETLNSVVTCPTDAVVVSGSRIDGLFNALSDLDVFVLTDSSEAAAEGAAIVIHDRGYYVDAEHLHRERLETLASDVEAKAQRTAPVSIADLSDMTLYYRLAIGQRLVSPPWAAALLDQRFRRAHLASALPRLGAGAASDALAKAQICLDLGFENSARMYLKDAAEWSIDVAAWNCGELNPARKWRFEKIARQRTRDSDEFWAAWSVRAPARLESTADYLERVQMYLRSVSAHAGDSTEVSGFVPNIKPSYGSRATQRGDEGGLLLVGSALYGLSARLMAAWQRVQGLPVRDDGDPVALVELSRLGATAAPLHGEDQSGFLDPAPVQGFLGGGALASPGDDKAFRYNVAAAEVLHVEGEALWHAALARANEYDLAGALHAEQYGVVAYAAQDLLFLAARDFLLRVGGTGWRARDAAEAAYLLGNLRDAGIVEAGPVLDGFIDLYLSDHRWEDTPDYVQEVARFIETRTWLRGPRGANGLPPLARAHLGLSRLVEQSTRLFELYSVEQPA